MYDCDNMQDNMDHFMQILEQNAYQNRIPLKGTFELTARCNFNCSMCYIHLGEEQIQQQGRELTNEEWLDIARQAKEAGMLYLTLTGGEVFVRPGFRELYEELAKMGFLLQILSNGYCIDERVMEWLGEMPPYAMRFTLYGASNETYRQVCGVKNGFDRVSHAIDLVKKTGIPFFMVSTIVKENQHDLEAMIKFAEEKDVQFKATTSVVKAVRGASQDVEAHRLSTYDAFEEELKKINGADRLYPHIEQPFALCDNYRKGYWITWNGNLQLCSFMDSPAISLLNGQDFHTAWRLLYEQLEQIVFPKECDNCEYEGFCSRCPGVLAAECGACSKTDQAFCNHAQTLYEIYKRKKGENE